MAELLCPKCSTTRVEPLPTVLLRRCGITTLATFFVGMVIMLVLGLFGLIQLGAVIWICLALAPILLFLHERYQHRRDPVYLIGYTCTYCGHRWVPGTEEPPPQPPELKDRLRLLEEQRQANPPR